MPPTQARCPDAAIELRGLVKIYPSRRGGAAKTALNGIDLVVPAGSIFGLLGPNGAGKSTLINILAGLVVKSGGTVSVYGIDIDRRPRLARLAIGVVPQELNLDAFFTPRETLELQAGLFGVAPRDRITDELLAAVGLTDRADAYARTLSGGMRRRLLVAKALVHRPPVVILDEPTAGVDVDLRRALWDYMRRLNARGVTIVLTTHYLEEAQALCDQVAIIDRGNLVACERTDLLLRRLDEKRVALRVEPVPTAIPGALADLDGRMDESGRIVLRYRPSVAAIDSLLDRVRDSGLRILDLETTDADLEDVFLRLTGRNPADPTAPAATEP